MRDLTRLYSVLRDAEAALQAWKRLSVVDPQNIDAFVQVASLSLATGKTAEAIEALETATAADPQNDSRPANPKRPSSTTKPRPGSTPKTWSPG